MPQKTASATPAARRSEGHAAQADAVRDVTLGMSDGLTTPSALAAGLAGAVSSSMLVVIGGLAEIAAGSTGEERAEVWCIFRDYGRRGSALEQATTAMTANRDAWMRFMMREELGLEEPAPRSAVQTVAIGGAAAAVAFGIGRVVSRLGV